MGDSLGAISHIKLAQGALCITCAFRGNPPVSLVPPISLLVGFPEILHHFGMDEALLTSNHGIIRPPTNWCRILAIQSLPHQLS